MSLPAKKSPELGELAAAPGAPAPDEEIVARVLSGDHASFELIMRRYNQRLFRVARSIIGEDSEAEDVVQEAYFRVYQHLRQFEGRSLFSTWLTKIAVHEATTRRRKQRRLRLMSPGKSEIDSMELHSTNRNASDEASQRELEHVLAGAVDALPPELRVVVTMRMIEQLSTNNTAECLDLTPANVKIRLHRARLLLRKWIDQRIGEEARRLYAFDGERCNRIVKNVMSRISNA
jgi:RNA polymerase sigma-70 factor, ECF subfamily